MRVQKSVTCDISILHNVTKWHTLSNRFCDVLEHDNYLRLIESSPMSNSSDYKKQVIKRTKEARLRHFKSQSDIAEKLQIERARYAKYETERIIAKEYMARFCALTHVSEAWLLTGRDEKKAAGKPTFSTIPIMGQVQAGVWKEAFEWEDERVFVSVPVGAHSNSNPYALTVRGDSMNLVYQDGDILIVVPLREFLGKLENGRKVIVERRKSDGIVEATVKELSIVKGRAELLTRSLNPKWPKSINIHWPYTDAQKFETETVEIKGVVIGLYRPEE